MWALVLCVMLYRCPLAVERLSSVRMMLMFITIAFKICMLL